MAPPRSSTATSPNLDRAKLLESNASRTVLSAPAESKPSATKPAAPKPAATKPIATKPTATKPTAAPPSETSAHDRVKLALREAKIPVYEQKSPYAFDDVHDALLDVEGVPEQKRAQRRFKIALFAWESLHSIAVGGVAPHLTELAAGLERRGHELHAFVRTGAGQPSYERIDGVHVHRISFELSSDFVQEVSNMCDAMVHFMLETEAFMNSQFDICHAHDWLAAPALINIKRNHNRRCVLTIHSTEFGRCGNNVYGGQSERIRNIESEAIGLADKVIGVSGVLCDEIKSHYGFDWEKLRCVYNGINCLRYDGNLWDPAEVRSKYGVGPMDPMVLFVGRMATQKGPDILVEAIPNILGARPDAKFVLVGDGYMKDGLIARVHDLGVAGSVCFTGSMTGQNLVDLFKATDLVAIPSRNEPFGIVTLEAWASNKPVVVTKSGGPREFVWHDNDGYLVDTSAEGIAWGICNAFTNFEHMRYMGERGRVKAAYQFSWDNIAENTNNVYDELLPDHPGHADLKDAEPEIVVGALKSKVEETAPVKTELPVDTAPVVGVTEEVAKHVTNV
ncbi:D-inositol-3-phosphate glycosyltransferase [Gracilaria domingensis]|nr:D-inositol-3-phosphate glycosyltransferase [Gracilaria domingensis]